MFKELPKIPRQGVIVFHTAANSMFKVTCEKDAEHKGQS